MYPNSFILAFFNKLKPFSPKKSNKNKENKPRLIFGKILYVAIFRIIWDQNLLSLAIFVFPVEYLWSHVLHIRLLLPWSEQSSKLAKKFTLHDYFDLHDYLGPKNKKKPLEASTQMHIKVKADRFYRKM